MPTPMLPSEPGPATVPASLLVYSPRNVRKLYTARNIEALAASIRKSGLLQNLVVSFDGTHYPVEGGERRRRAIHLLIEQGVIAPDWPVRVLIVPESESKAASLTENLQREEMHPADQFTAFRELTGEGWTIEEIADAYGVTPLVVERRLALAGAAPALFEMLRHDEITTEQLAALCATDNHALQESVWHSMPSWNRQPATLRRAVVATEVDVTNDDRVRFIGGRDAYVAAGGTIRRDLFSADGQGGFAEDAALLERLVAQDLEAAATALRAEGWGWVEIWPTWSYSDFFQFGRIQRVAVDLSPENASRIGALREEASQLSAEEQAILDALAEDDSDPAEEVQERLDAIHARLEEIHAEAAAIEEGALAFEPEAVAVTGALVSREGSRLRIERGLVRPADRARVAEAVGGEAVTGGRTTEPAGRKSGELSDPLRRSLFGHRNLAVQTVTARSPEVAKVLLACWIVQRIRQPYPRAPLDLRISDVGSSGTRTQHPIVDEGGEQRHEAFDQIGAGLVAGLPADEGALWDALAQMEGSDLDRLVAFGVASAVSVTREHTGLTAKLLSALGFDMADHFTPTAANYLSRVPKALILTALEEAGCISGEAERSTLLAMKKGDLAARGEAMLEGTRWVPALIRTPAPVPQMVEPPKKRRAGSKGRRRAVALAA